MTERLWAGIDLGATNIKYGLLDNDGAVRYRNHLPTPDGESAEKLFEKIVYCGEQLLLLADEEEAAVGHIGVGSPGSVNVRTGIIQGTCPNLSGWVGFHLRDRLAERLNIPVFVDNDANCAALAEHRFGAGRGYDNLICLTIGTGIGGGLILDGRLYRGAGFSAGEVGHMPASGVDEDGGGKILESLVSSRAILAELKERLQAGMSPVFQSLLGGDLSRLTIRKAFAAVKKNDSTARDVIGRSARILARALVGLVNVYNPERIILGGGIAEAGTVFVDIVSETVMAEALPAATDSLTVVAAELGNAAGFIGAAILGEGEKSAG